MLSAYLTSIVVYGYINITFSLGSRVLFIWIYIDENKEEEMKDETHYFVGSDERCGDTVASTGIL